MHAAASTALEFVIKVTCLLLSEGISAAPPAHSVLNVV